VYKLRELYRQLGTCATTTHVTYPSLSQPLPTGCTGRSILNSDDYCVPAPADAVTAMFKSAKPTLASLGVSSPLGCALLGLNWAI
jgi:hypothetical protein